MDKNLSWKIALVVALVILAAWTLYPPSKTLKPGIDLGGGTSLIYEVDAKGLGAEEKRGLSERVITVLRRRIDPANIQIRTGEAGKRGAQETEDRSFERDTLKP